MKKLFLLGIIGLLGLLCRQSYAQTVCTNTAQTLARTFWNNYRPADTKPVSSVTPMAFSELPHLHVFSINGQGFVIVAGDERVRPILAYSFDSPFPEELNPEVGYWLRGYEAQIAEVAESGIPQDEGVHRQWLQLECAPYSEEPVGSLLNIPAMMTTRWNQGSPYNMYCPYDSIHHGRTVVGCVATAMAQIMRYWQYPSFGRGSRTYNYRYFGDISADFRNTTYLWQFMPNTIGDHTPEHKNKAVATISFHCGVAVEMMYGTSSQGGSGAYSECGEWTNSCATSAFVEHFKYDSALHHVNRDDLGDDSAWTALLDIELAAGRPMYYSGSDSTGGHAFVCDGADLQGRYHFNWGWAGYGDGFYTVNNLAPGTSDQDGGNATYTFNRWQGIIIGIQPGEVETFDTVDYYDSICSDTRYITFRDYTLNVAAMDTLLRHLDTIFNYHLKVISKKIIRINPNNGMQTDDIYEYCPATGFVFPECEYTKENSYFIGWCHSRSGDDAIYQPGQHIMLNANRTFYALWMDTIPVGISDVEGTDPVTLWPNPTSGELNINLADGDNAQIVVIDALGRILLQKDYIGTSAESAKISLAGLPEGIYNVQIRTTGGIYNRRVIKQ